MTAAALFKWIFTGILILGFITVVAAILSERCRQIDEEERRK